MNHSLTTNLPSIPQKLYNVQNSYQLSLQAYAVGVFFLQIFVSDNVMVVRLIPWHCGAC